MQHEYGLYTGPDGAAVIDVIEAITVPTIVVAHTVLAQPSPGQQAVLRRICDAVEAVVVMTATARDRLIACYRRPRPQGVGDRPRGRRPRR